jgi:NADH:ubiquinone oxidoreductase subunit 4 (subunit M)
MKILKQVGSVLIIAGFLATAGYGLVMAILELLKDTNVPTFIVAGTLAIITGIVLVLASFIIERFKDK